jgi:hypothetical protein
MVGMRMGDDRAVDGLPRIDVKIAVPAVNAGRGHFQEALFQHGLIALTLIFNHSLT